MGTAEFANSLHRFLQYSIKEVVDHAMSPVLRRLDEQSHALSSLLTNQEALQCSLLDRISRLESTIASLIVTSDGGSFHPQDSFVDDDAFGSFSHVNGSSSTRSSSGRLDGDVPFIKRDPDEEPSTVSSSDVSLSSSLVPFPSSSATVEIRSTNGLATSLPIRHGSAPESTNDKLRGKTRFAAPKTSIDLNSVSPNPQDLFNALTESLSNSSAKKMKKRNDNPSPGKPPPPSGTIRNEHGRPKPLAVAQLSPFICSICSKRFQNKYMLARHNTVHTGSRPHQCPYCKRCFSQRCTLNVHIRLHTGDLRFKCDLCGKKFNRSFDLKLHNKKAHPMSSS